MTTTTFSGAGGVDFLLPDGVSSDQARTLLAGRFAIADDPAQPFDRVYFDSFDGRLHAAGLQLLGEDARLVLRDGSTELADGPAVRSGRVSAAELPSGRLRELLAPVLEMRAATPVARLRSRVQLLRILDDEGKTVVRLALDEPVVDGERRLEPRVHAEGVRGYEDELSRVARTLEQELGFLPTRDSVFDAAVIAAGGSPGGVSSKLAVSLRPDDAADDAATALLLHLANTIALNLPGAIDDVDSEFLHDLRVAVRRTRSAQRQLKCVFPPEPLQRFRDEFRWVQQVTGPVRDLDVYLLGFDDLVAELDAERRAELVPLRTLLRRHRSLERRRMVRALRSPRFTSLLEEWPAFVSGLVASPADDRPHAKRPIVEVAGKRIRRTYRRMLDDGGQIDDASPGEALHDLRKLGKELRYLLEFFSSLYPAKVVKPMVGDLKQLQDVLGRFHDREVQAATIRSLRDEVAQFEGGAAALMAMGLLVERIEADQAAARSEFAERFEAFAGDRELVRKTFA